jgi:hypothetical protein
MKFEATYSFNVRRFIKCEIEAATSEEAERLAESQAWPTIDAEICSIQNSDGFSDAAELYPYMFLDGSEGDVICERPLIEPEPEL